jgi:hypothetical protein
LIGRALGKIEQAGPLVRQQLYCNIKVKFEYVFVWNTISAESEQDQGMGREWCDKEFAACMLRCACRQYSWHWQHNNIMLLSLKLGIDK